MARPKTANQIESLRRQQAEIAAKLKEATAKEKAALKETASRRNTLAGIVALGVVDEMPDSEFARIFRAALAVHLKKPADRALFNLPDVAPPMQSQTTPETETAAV